jgi:hypothetical protein
LDENIDQALYTYQKSTDKQVARLAKILNFLLGIEEKLKKVNQGSTSHAALLNALQKLQLEGRDQPQDRQVGAWQSSKITPYSLIKNTLKFSKARLNIPSEDDWRLLEAGEKQIDLFKEKVAKFKRKWAKEISALVD